MPNQTVRALALVALGAIPFTPALADGGAGAYLAARHASIHSDYDAATQFYVQALIHDPSNSELLENAITSFVNLGEMDRAMPLAQRMQGGGLQSQIAHVVMTAGQVMTDDFDGLLADIEAGRRIGPLVDGLLRAWAQVGEGRISDALAAFDSVSDRPGLSAFAVYHKALALASVGDFEAAHALFSGEASSPLQRTRRGAMAHAQILSQLQRNNEAIDLIDRIFGKNPDPTVTLMRNRLVGGGILPFTQVTSAREGVAEVFYSVAAALSNEASESFTLFYSRTAEYLRPNHVDAILLSAQLLENLERYELANATYDRVPRDHPAFHEAELGRAEALRRSDKPEAAIEVLQQLGESHGNLPIVHITKGDMLRGLERFGEAAEAYEQAISLYPDGQRGPWFVYYARGISYEREGRWDEAEADFRAALDINPGQPSVLNYLGYSLVEMDMKLDEALQMIEDAAEARPDSGYIIDSLGWVLYRLGRYDEAVVHMERAAELLPIDPIVNDHLGDVYWSVGRATEARFQWQRALSFDPEPDEAKRIRRKLEVGLDAVLAEEKVEPVQVANDDG